jgi:integrase/recombinase XerD
MADSQSLVLAGNFAREFAPLKKLVMDAITSELTRAMYGKALDDFFEWWGVEGRPVFDRETVQRYRTHLVSQSARRGRPQPGAVDDGPRLAASTINLRLSAIRKLASEASYKTIDPVATQRMLGVRDVKGIKTQGVRTGNWLTTEQAQRMLNAPKVDTLKGRRDQAILALLFGCGLRRDEAARLSLDQIQQRDGRWCIPDLIGKHGRMRTVPMPSWAKVAIDRWVASAGITTGRVFRGVNRGDKVTGAALTSQGIWRCVEKYAAILEVKITPHDLRRTFAKLAHQGRAKLDQIQISLGHASLVTTEKYLGVQQDLSDAPCDYLDLKIEAA